MAEKTTSKNVKAVDLFENKDELILQAVIGGVEISELDISITNDMITIRGERNKEDKDKIEKVYFNPSS